MISQATYKREKRRLALAQGKFNKAAAAVRAVPNLYSAELDGKGLEIARELRARASNLEKIAGDALELFEREGFPDTWSSWARAREDARRARIRAEDILESMGEEL